MAAACETLAASAVELLEKPDVLLRAQKEFEERRRGRPYQSVLDAGPPPEKLDAGAYNLGAAPNRSQGTVAEFSRQTEQRETP